MSNMVEIELDLDYLDDFDGIIIHDEFDELDDVVVYRARHAKRIIVANGATGHCNCSLCGGLIGIQDLYCKHCGARLEPEDPHLMRGGADE
jgi:hypothetical protein